MSWRCVVVAVVLLLVGSRTGSAQAGAPLPVLATTSTLAALASPVLGTPVPSLVPIGVSPEDYQPTPQDIGRLHDARVLIENGAGLEAWLQPTIRNAGNPKLQQVVCTAELPVRAGNPHLWMDPVFAEAYVAKIRDAVAAADPADAARYRTAAARYTTQLRALEARTRRKIASLPPDHRNLIVFHNALDYYAARFGLRVIGAIEPTPGAEPNPAHIAELVRMARANHVRAVFAEPEFSPKLAKALAQEAGIRTVTTIYDDSVGTDPRVATYIGMIDYDTDTIVAALK